MATTGVQHPIAEDMALIGDTRQELHTKSLPRKSGPNFGAESHAGPDPNQLRIEGYNAGKHSADK